MGGDGSHARIVRSRGIPRALRLAAEQREELELKSAPLSIRRCEKKLQMRENRRHLKRRISRNACKTLFEEKQSHKCDGHGPGAMINNAAFGSQQALKRCTLGKRATASFSLPMSKEHFLKLWKGHAKTESNDTEDVLSATMDGERQRDTSNELAEALGIEPNEGNWVIRRMCGLDPLKRRDCAHIHVQKSHADEKNTKVMWKSQTLRQIDIRGTERVASKSRMTLRFPRNVAPCSSKLNAEQRQKHQELNAKKAEKASKRCRVGIHANTEAWGTAVCSWCHVKKRIGFFLFTSTSNFPLTWNDCRQAEKDWQILSCDNHLFELQANQNTPHRAVTSHADRRIDAMQQNSPAARRSIRVVKGDAKTSAPAPADSKVVTQKLPLKGSSNLQGLAHCLNKSSACPVKNKTNSVVAVKRNKSEPAKKKAAEKSVRRRERAKRTFDRGPRVASFEQCNLTRSCLMCTHTAENQVLSQQPAARGQHEHGSSSAMQSAIIDGLRAAQIVPAGHGAATAASDLRRPVVCFRWQSMQVNFPHASDDDKCNSQLARRAKSTICLPPKWPLPLALLVAVGHVRLIHGA
eukprot:jgi/Bigna1/84483/fgenesh1_pg.141_\